MFEQPKSQAALIAEKLGGMSEERLKALAEDPVGEISTKPPEGDSVWKGMDAPTISDAAKQEIQKRGI